MTLDNLSTELSYVEGLLRGSTRLICVPAGGSRTDLDFINRVVHGGLAEVEGRSALTILGRLRVQRAFGCIHSIERESETCDRTFVEAFRFWDANNELGGLYIRQPSLVASFEASLTRITVAILDGSSCRLCE